MPCTALFVGLSTIDITYLVDHAPASNEKLTAKDLLLVAGGPASNAAVTCAYLGGEATLVSSLGNSPLSQIALQELLSHKLSVIDVSADSNIRPTVSSILVTEATGERAVVSINSRGVAIDAESFEPALIDNMNIVLVDGHHIEMGISAARYAKERGVTVVVDGGSWKPGMERLLENTSCAICSDNFFPPECETEDQVFIYLASAGVTYAAITHGNRPLSFRSPSDSGTIEVPKVQIIDTLGAGDIFHGAFVYYFSETGEFVDSLRRAAGIASQSCTSFGTRSWMKDK